MEVRLACHTCVAFSTATTNVYSRLVARQVVRSLRDTHAQDKRVHVSCYENSAVCCQNLKQRGFVLTGPDITQHGKRQRMHAGPGWSHLPIVGYNDSGTLYFETGIAHLPNPACIEDSGTFVEFRKSSHTDQAPVITIAVTPMP